MLREILCWRAAEVASFMTTSVAAVNSALQRARATLGSKPVPPARDEGALRSLLDRYMQAWESGAPDVLATVLREDAILTMPPMAAWLAGRDAIADFLAFARVAFGEIKCVPAVASGGPAVAMYVRKPGDDRFRATAIHVPVFEGDRMVEVHAFLLPNLFPLFALPESIG